MKTALGIVLSLRFPGCVVWGPGLVILCNAACLPFLGGKPETPGQSFAGIWRDFWPRIDAIAQRAYAGEAGLIEDFSPVPDRNPHQTFCISAIRDESGMVDLSWSVGQPGNDDLFRMVWTETGGPRRCRVPATGSDRLSSNTPLPTASWGKA